MKSNVPTRPIRRTRAGYPVVGLVVRGGRVIGVKVDGVEEDLEVDVEAVTKDKGIGEPVSPEGGTR